MTAQPQRILALDIATVTGWAVAGGGVTTSGSQSFARHPGNKTRPADHVGASFLRFNDWLREMIATQKPDVIVYEKAQHMRSGAAVDLIVGFRGILMLHAAKANVRTCHCVPAQLKKYWTGNGRAEKADMMAATRRRFPDIQLTDDNESDALAVLSFFQAQPIS